MNHSIKSQRILILLLLSICVVTPIVIVSNKLDSFSTSEQLDRIHEDTLRFKYTTESIPLHAIQQEEGEILEEPDLIVYKDSDESTGNSLKDKISTKNTVDMDAVTGSLKRNGFSERIPAKLHPNTSSIPTPNGSKKQVQLIHIRGEESNVHTNVKGTDEKVRHMKDHMIRAKAYLNFAPPNSNSHLVKELRLRIRELERVVGDASKDSDLSQRAFQRMKAMETTLLKASRVYPDCSAMAIKLRAMAYNSEEQIRAQKRHTSYLNQLATRTYTKGLHCLSMRLTTDFFALKPEEREFHYKHNPMQSNLYHFALFSDNILACAVVVNSTISTFSDPEKMVFHVITDAINFPAFSMWFLANPPGLATIQVKSIDDFDWLSSYSHIFKQQDGNDPRFCSSLNHLRFYLPQLFPELEKVVFLDHDVVVQKNLRDLWSINMKGKVNGAVWNCGNGGLLYRMEGLINFTDQTVAKSFDAKSCTWGFGMNIFDLREWRKLNLTSVYHKWLQLGKRKRLFKSGSLPLGLVTFYNHTTYIDRRWHLPGLGFDPDLGRKEIEKASVIHYNGAMKPWLDIGIAKYKAYWNKFVNYDHPYLQQCNVHA